MKIKLIQYIIFTFITASVMAQYPCYNGISTNPLNPINTQLPSKTNTFFNWQDSIWQQRILTTCGRDTAFQESPFFKTDNVVISSVSLIAVTVCETLSCFTTVKQTPLCETLWSIFNDFERLLLMVK